MQERERTSVIFRTNYYTKVGKCLAIVGDHVSFGEWVHVRSRKLHYVGDGNWELQFLFDAVATPALRYRYIIIDSDSDWAVEELGAERTLDIRALPKGAAQPTVLHDFWKAPGSLPVLKNFNSALFTKCIFGRDQKKQQHCGPLPAAQGDNVVVHFSVHSVFVPRGYHVRVCGDGPTLGNWDLTKAPEMKDGDFPVWRLNLQIPRSHADFGFKYVICNEHVGDRQWEEGPNRQLDARSSGVAMLDASPFRRGDRWKGTGVSIPIFSIRTKDGLGVGEFLDLKVFADWASSCGLKIVQILPVNDTSVNMNWKDSYPYSALSVNALHPMYLRLERLTSDPALLKTIQAKKQELNSLEQVDYEAVMHFKLAITKTVFQKEVKTTVDPEYQSWFKKNKAWLIPYALFCVFRDQYGTTDWSQWKDQSAVTPSQLIDLSSPSSKYLDQLNYYYWVQYNLHLQLKEATDYTKDKGIGLKGDIAIGVNKGSCDTWAQPHLFNLNKSTGAPPDFFAEDGQNWGFPTYNWEEMAKDDFMWWRQRLAVMDQYFSAFRIDHILGFFRIWEIPSNCATGLLGRFNPSAPIWRHELEGNGMWDTDRLCEPYIRYHLFNRYFGIHEETVRLKYFDDLGHGIFKFKPQFASEKAIKKVSTDPKDEGIIRGLLKLIQNVVLLRDDHDPNKFYPRIELFKTDSYNELADGHKAAMYRLYLDYFYYRQESLWSQTALERLPMMIHSNNMLCCGEDLGMVPRCVAPVMQKLNILGLRIQRMPDDPKKEFMHPGEYPYLSVCTPSVHDTSTVRGWWEEDYGTSQRFFSQILGIPGPAPRVCEDWVMRSILGQHLGSDSMLAIFPVQDLLGLKHKYYAGRDPTLDRINIPAIAEHYWRYRMHISMEELIADTDFSDDLRHFFQTTGRWV